MGLSFRVVKSMTAFWLAKLFGAGNPERDNSFNNLPYEVGKP